MKKLIEINGRIEKCLANINYLLKRLNLEEDYYLKINAVDLAKLISENKLIIFENNTSEYGFIYNNFTLRINNKVTPGYLKISKIK